MSSHSDHQDSRFISPRKSTFGQFHSILIDWVGWPGVSFRFWLHGHCRVTRDSNLVDSASSIRLSQRLSHACLSINKSILWNCEWLIISVIVYLMVLATWITVVILELIHASNPDSRRGVFIRWKPMRGHPRILVIHNNFRIDLRIDASFKFLPYQLWMVGYWPTMALTGNGELGFDSGEGAWETATTSKEGSRRANYPILTQGGSDKK